MTVLVTGGSGSGKSEFAEMLISKMNDGPKIYLAAMKPLDEESRLRIRRHRDMRKNRNFVTVEQYLKIGNAEIPEGSDVLLECLSNLTANEMFDPAGSGDDPVSAVITGIRMLQKKTRNLVIVTNEIFSDGKEYPGDTELYKHYLGQINREAAKMSDQVFEVIYGIPVRLKGVFDEGFVEQL